MSAHRTRKHTIGHCSLVLFLLGMSAALSSCEETEKNPCFNVSSAECNTLPCGNLTCSGATPICEESSKTCVGCLQDSDCGDPATPLCNTTTKTCQAGCSASVACQRFAQAPVCNAATGACVQCTAQERQACGSNVCDAATSTCSTFAQQSANLCQPCVADAQCQANQLCVPLTLAGTNASYGNYCMNRGPQGCANSRPYFRGETLTSVDGTQAQVCVSRTSTCPALNVDFSQTTCGAANASGDAQCGLPNLNDGVCVQAGGVGSTTYRCSVPCASNDDCPLGAFQCTVTSASSPTGKACTL